MRDGTLRGLKFACVGAMCLGISTAQADDPPASVALEAPPTIHLGDRFEVVAQVRVPSDLPLLVTPTSEGGALEVVRGRLLRGDASDPEAEVLTFRIPIVARSTGTAVLRVRVQTWVCVERCRPLRAEARLTIRVLPEHEARSRSTDRVVGSAP